MCGIAGKLWFDPDRPADEGTVAAMTAALAHRGPDDAGFAALGPAALGHRRLSILDLSPRGRQPFIGQDGQCLLVVNGEIYNHAELRKDLTRRGHTLKSNCDCEVLLPLYRQWFESEGPAFVDRLTGMFAFALWDGRDRRLVLGRDRTGQKPLVYALTAESITFASELGALRREPALDRRPDWSALSDYLAFRTVPHPRTAWRGAAKLPPAHVLVVEDGKVQSTRTWCLAAGSDVSAAPSLDEAADGVASRFRRAVQRRLMADVPVGALLSGGVDSAAVVAAMVEGGGGPVKTFTIGFEDPAYDETAAARKVARLFGTEHHEQIVRPGAVSLLDDLLRHYGEPFADASAIPTFLVSQMAARHVKVVLTGDGGDESFAGYDRYRALALAARLDGRRAAPLRAGLRAAVAAAGWIPAGGHRSLSTRLGRFGQALAAGPRHRNHLWRLAMTEPVRAGLLTPQGAELLGPPSHYGPDVAGPLSLNEALILDVERYLPDDLLVKLDIASMAWSLEARSPFLDHELMEYAASLPGRAKLRGRTTKRVLRRALRRWLPADVLAGPKRGFGVPLDAWLRGPLRRHAEEVLLGPEARHRGLFDQARVGALLKGHADRKVAAHETLYTLLVLERWFQQEDLDP